MTPARSLYGGGPTSFLGQPQQGKTLIQLIDLAKSGEFTHLDAAVAYASLSGSCVLIREMPSQFNLLQKRWVIGIDWCRSDPSALRQLDALANSSVRIHDGVALVRRSGCTPRVTYHPKLYLFRGPTSSALVAGSSNLSENGLTRGHEAGILLKSESRTSSASAGPISSARTWFDALWASATPFGKIAPAYDGRFSERIKNPMPTDDDSDSSGGSGRRTFFTDQALAQLRICKNFWIEAGNLSRNRGRMVPGNQLMMKALTRVFFGFRSDVVPTDTHFGYVTIEFEGILHNDRSLRFSDNSMDVLTLPTHGATGDASYDRRTLHFEQVIIGTQIVYRLSLGSPREHAVWLSRSKDVGASYSMTSGRQFGFF